ncbi:MAG: sugar ABC transporter permease [Proteus hauseri]|nr:sugar ABC transporter permease [Proteus hauseri]
MQKRKSIFTKKNGFILAFLLPGVLLFAVIYAYPLVNIFVTSFSKWNYKNFTNPEFLGWGHLFDNYIKLFTVDTNFKVALINTLKWVVLTMVVQIPFTLLVALVLARKPKGWRFTRNAFIIPNIISTAAIGLIFLNIYSPSRGIITEICNWISPGSNISVLANEKYAFWGVTFAFILFGGSSCLLLLTQIFYIDSSLF